MAYSPKHRFELPPVGVIIAAVIGGSIGLFGTLACVIVRELLRLF